MAFIIGEQSKITFSLQNTKILRRSMREQSIAVCVLQTCLDCSAQKCLHCTCCSPRAGWPWSICLTRSSRKFTVAYFTLFHRHCSHSPYLEWDSVNCINMLVLWLLAGAPVFLYPLLVEEKMRCASCETIGGLLSFLFLSVTFSKLCFANEAKVCKFHLNVCDYVNL